MNIKEIVKANKAFNIWESNMNEQMKTKRDSLKEVNSQLDLQEFKSISYAEAKKAFEVIKHNLSYGEERNTVAKVLEEMKEKEYPELLKAHYYPILNELEDLTDKQKNKLDSTLVRFVNSEIMTRSNAWSDINLSREKTAEIMEFLYEKGIAERSYNIRCQCGRDGDYMSQSTYNEHEKFFEIEDKIRHGTETKEEYDWYDKFENEDKRVWMVGCFECEGRELLSMKDIDENSSFVYRNVTQPDMTYANM